MDIASKKALWIILTVIALLAIAFWVLYWRGLSTEYFGIPFESRNQNSELVSIEAGVNAIELSNLDAELNSMEKEINQ